MPSFDLGTIEPLKCTLKPFVDFDENLREPSDQQIGQFLADYKQVYKNAQGLMNAANAVEALSDQADEDGTGSPDAEELMTALDQLDGDQYVELMADVAQAYSRLLSGRPSTEQLLSLPLRARTYFFNWIMTEVVRPEAESGAGQTEKPKPKLVRSA